MDSDNNVIQLTPRTDQPARLVAKKDTARYCPHEQITVNIDERLVECSRCGAVLDPFEFLWTCATKETNHFHTLHWQRLELKRIEENKLKLLKEIANLKAQRRRL